MADRFADRFYAHSGQYAVYRGITAAAADDFGEDGGGRKDPVPIVVGDFQPYIHGAVSGRLRHSFAVEHHHSGGTGSSPPPTAHALRPLGPRRSHLIVTDWPVDLLQLRDQIAEAIML